MTYDEAKAVALEHFSPHVGEAVLDVKRNNQLTVLSIARYHGEVFVVLKTQYGSNYAERIGAWRRRVRNKLYV